MYTNAYIYLVAICRNKLKYTSFEKAIESYFIELLAKQVL